MASCNTCGSKLDTLTHVMFFTSNVVACPECGARLETTIPNPTIVCIVLGAITGSVMINLDPGTPVPVLFVAGFLSAYILTGLLAVLLPKSGAS
jgi:uncharacterized Zn finger protein